MAPLSTSGDSGRHLLARGREAFAVHLDAVTPDEWDLPTRCGRWTVADLATHVIGATEMHMALADGGSVRQAVVKAMNPTLSSRGPAADFATAAGKLEQRLSRSGVRAATFHHPAGEVDGSTLLIYAVVEWVVHASDLAHALRRPWGVNEDLAESVYAAIAPKAAQLTALGAFDPPLTILPGAPAKERLLALLGRPSD